MSRGDRFEAARLPDVYDSPEGYERFSYSGAAGLLMRLNHRLMERGIRPRDNERVLDVGGLSMPHWHWMDSTRTRSYVFVGDPRHFEHVQVPETLRGADISVVDHRSPDHLESLEPGLTRVVASHVLEHVQDPEHAMLSWCRLLREDGKLSIALPCDPGWAWRLLQHLSYRSAVRTLGFSSRRERDLFQSRDHVTPASNVLKILRYYFKRLDVVWFPALVPVMDFNVLCIVQASMRDYYKSR